MAMDAMVRADGHRWTSNRARVLPMGPFPTSDKEVAVSLNVPLLRASFDLVVSNEPQLAKRFYEVLFERYPAAQAMFGGRVEAQATMLTEALVAVVDHLDDAPWLAETLGALGARHVGYGVTEEMYGWVGECLLATLEEVAGDQWTLALAQAWVAAYKAIVSLMLAGEAQARAA